jgi:predicted esterase
MYDSRGTEVRWVQAVTHGRVLVRAAGASHAQGILVGFHGYAEDAQVQMRRLENIPGSARWVLASVQALNRFYRGRSEDVVAGWMTREDREIAIADNIKYVNEAIASVLDVSGASERRPNAAPLFHIGFSQGVAMAFRAAVRGRFGSSGVIAVGGDVPPELLAGPDSRFPPVLLARGDRDEWYTAPKLEQDVSVLRSRGVEVRPFVFDGGHEWHDALNDEAERFLRGTATAA